MSGISKGISGKFELILIHPYQFLTHGSFVEIKHPITEALECFVIPQNSSGFLREKSPTGPRLPPFSSRGEVPPKAPLNPILVNFAAAMRLRRLIGKDPAWGSELDETAISILRGVIRLHQTVTWNPEDHPHSIGTLIPIKMPGSEESKDLSDWPFFPVRRGIPKSGPSSPVVHLKTQRAHKSAIDMLDLMEARQGSFLIDFA